jgi:hypothetical protein
MASAITITIAGVDKTSLIDWQSLVKNEVVTKESDSLTFVIKNFGTKTYQPTLGNEVVFTYGSVKKFGGYVVQMNEIINGLQKELQVIVKDYSQILDRQLVSKIYIGQTATAIIQDLIATFTSGITTTNVVAPIVIPKVVFNYLTVSECMKQLAKILSSYEWYIDYDKDIHFFSTTTQLAPFSISDTTQNFVFGSLKIQNDTSQLRNEVIVRGGLVTSTTLRTEYFSGDAVKTSFPLSNNYPSVPTITVGGVSKTVGTDFVDQDTSYQVMWNKDTQSIRFTAGNTPASATNNIVVTGYPQYPLILRKQNQASVTLYGLFQSIIIDKTIQDITAASARADVELNKHSLPEAIGSFTTYTDGLISGQLLTVASTIRGISRTFKIQSIKTTLKTPASQGSAAATLRYDVQIVSADYTSINDVLSQLLVQDPASQIEISEDEVVQRYYLFPETMTFTDTLNAPSKSTGPYLWGSFNWGFGTWS